MSGEPVQPASVELPTPYRAPRAGTLVVLLRLHWFIRLRWVFVVTALGVLAAERFAFPQAQRPWQLLMLVLTVGLVNVLWTVVSGLLDRQLSETGMMERASGRSAQIFGNAQVTVDLLLLTAILHYSGGTENPMSVFYLFHVAISGLLLETWHALVQSTWAALSYALVAVAEWQHWLGHHALLPPLQSFDLYDNGTYVLLVVTVQVCAIYATLYFMLHIASQLDRQEAELVRTNEALERSRVAIQDLQRRRARFMQTAAHQLKSPLAIVQTLANLIRDGIVSDPEGIRATCDKIARRSREGIAQVTELLTLARVQQADPVRHQRSQADVREIVEELYQHYKPLAREKQLELTCWITPQRDLRVQVDPPDLRDCIGNLIDNAIKYTSEGGRVRVAVTAKTQQGRPITVGIHVSDTGMGFDTQLLRSAGKGKVACEELAFDAFRRGANVIKAGIPGTGLGLSIVREVVEQAGGRIWVMSRPGAGTAFTITLPISGAAAPGHMVRDTRATDMVLESPPENGQAGG